MLAWQGKHCLPERGNVVLLPKIVVVSCLIVIKLIDQDGKKPLQHGWPCQQAWDVRIAESTVRRARHTAGYQSSAPKGALSAASLRELLYQFRVRLQQEKLCRGTLPHKSKATHSIREGRGAPKARH